MNITVFTGNQPRHISLIRELSKVADKVYAIQECRTVFPGQVQDHFNKTPIMQTYFEYVMDAEKDIFGDIDFLPSNVYQLPIKSEDINRLSLQTIHAALQSEVYVVFGGGYIKGELIDFLVEHKAVNIHMGVSPYYRGSSCNFWAAYDGHPEMIGATIHMLSKGLDSGSMLYHALPKPEETDTFKLGMKAVKVAHDSLVERIANGDIWKYTSVAQDKSREIRYSRYDDFNDMVAKEYLNSPLAPEEVYRKLVERDMNMFLNPFVN